MRDLSDSDFGADILISRPHLDNWNIRFINEYVEAGILRSVLLDCGAFTYNKKGIEMPVEDYMAYLKECPIPVWRYFALDKIGDPQTTMENLYKMYDAGFNPIPVWQRGMTRAHIDEMYELSDLVAIGGIVGRHQLMKWVIRKLWPKGRKAHILGLGSRKLISELNPYSIDCSNFAAASRWGRLEIYLGGNRWLQGMLYGQKPSADQRRIIRQCGFDVDSFRYRSTWYNCQHSDDEFPPLAPIPTVIAMTMWQWYSLDLRARNLTRVFMAFCTNRDFMGIPHCVEKARALYKKEV